MHAPSVPLKCVVCPAGYIKDHTDSFSACMQALAELEYPGKLQRLLLTPEREVLTPQCLLSDPAFTHVL